MPSISTAYISINLFFNPISVPFPGTRDTLTIAKSELAPPPRKPFSVMTINASYSLSILKHYARSTINVDLEAVTVSKLQRLNELLSGEIVVESTGFPVRA